MTSFNEIFNEAILLKTVVEPKNEHHKEALKNFYYLMFNFWLKGNKNYTYNNKGSNLITKDNWIEYIKVLESNETGIKSINELKKLSWQQINELTIKYKIHSYKEIEHNVLFRNLIHTIETFIGFMKPLSAEFNILKYFDFFFKNIEFDEIESWEVTKKETQKYFQTIYWGLENMFRSDINKAILNFQENIPNLSKNEAIEIQKELIALIGNLKRQTRGNKEGISFTERYNLLLNNIKDLSIDYNTFIAHFNETFSNDLLCTFEIINETLHENILLLKEKESSNINHFKIIDETFNKYKEEIFNILNSEPINLDTLEQDVRIFTVNSNNFISKYHKIALNDALLMIELKQKVNDLKFIIEQLITVTIMNEKPKQYLGFQGINASKLLVSFIQSSTELFIKDNTTSTPQPIEKTEKLIKNSNEDLTDNSESNNVTISTIEDWLFEFKEQNVLTEPNYSILVDALNQYFENGKFPNLETFIKVGRVNKKLFGWHLNRIFHAEGKGVDIELLRFAKTNISLFTNVDFDENDLQKSNLYKYFTTKTK